MTKNELNKYKTLLEAKQAELAGGLRNREGIAIEKTADALDEVQLAGERELAIRNLGPHQNGEHVIAQAFGFLGADHGKDFLLEPGCLAQQSQSAQRRSA